LALPFQGEVEGVIGVLPKDAWKADNASGILVYHHLLQRAILQYLVFQQSRRAGKMTTSACGREPEIWQERHVSTSVIAADDIKRTFAANRFILAAFFPPQIELVVPKGTRLLGDVPSNEPGHELGVIELKNYYFDLKIETGFGQSMRGIQGNYARLTSGGADREDSRFSSLSYGIRVMGKGSPLNRLFPFHADTTTYGDWVQQITKDLTCIFDERERWKFMVDELNFRHLIGAKK
jgi:hypothetical protein